MEGKRKFNRNSAADTTTHQCACLRTREGFQLVVQFTAFRSIYEQQQTLGFVVGTKHHVQRHGEFSVIESDGGVVFAPERERGRGLNPPSLRWGKRSDFDV